MACTRRTSPRAPVLLYIVYNVTRCVALDNDVVTAVQRGGVWKAVGAEADDRGGFEIGSSVRLTLTKGQELTGGEVDLTDQQLVSGYRLLDLSYFMTG